MARHTTKLHRPRAPATVGALIAAYRKVYEAARQAATEEQRYLAWHGGTTRLHGHVAAHLAACLGRVRLADLSEQRITDYGLRREAQGAAADLINDELRALGWVLDWARKQGYIARAPTIWFVRRPPQLPRMPRWPFVAGAGRDTGRLGFRQRRSSDATPAATAAPNKKKAGRPAWVSVEEYCKHLARHDGYLSPRQRANILTAELGRPVSKDQVNRLRRKVPTPASPTPK